MAKRYWLMKSEPDVFGIEDLKRAGREPWDGVRNYQARNFMRDDMKVGDEVLFYHSNAKPPGVAGLARISREGFADHTAFDPKAKYYDSKSDPDNPRWFMVEVEYVETFNRFIPLNEIRDIDGLEDMLLIRKGQRLSIQPVTPQEFRILRKIGRSKR